VFAGDQQAVVVEQQAVAAGFVAVSERAAEAGRFHPGAPAGAFDELDDAVVGNVGEQDVAFVSTVVRNPDRALGPFETASDDFDLRILRDEFIEGRVEPDDFADGGKITGVLGDAGKRDEEREEQGKVEKLFHGVDAVRGPRRLYQSGFAATIEWIRRDNRSTRLRAPQILLAPRHE